MSQDKLRIVQVHASDLGGGAERSVLSLHRGLRAAGHESTLFVGECRTSETGVEQIPYVRGVPGTRRLARALEHRLGWQDIYNPSFRHLVKLLEGRFDIVHFHSLWGSSGYADLSALPAITRRVRGVITLRDEWLLTGHCAYFHQCERWRTGCGECPNLELAPAIPVDGTRFNWRRKRGAIAASDLHVVTISDHMKRLVEASPIFSGKPVTRIYNGIDLAVFHQVGPEQRSIVRASLGFLEGDVVVLLAGQTVEGVRQGIASHHAVAALNANRDIPGVKALVIGRSAERVTQQLQVPSVVLPFQSNPADMARCYQVADITLVTSEVEAFGRIGAESQACGTPVVAFDTGGIPEVVVEGVGGRLVPRRDTKRLTEVLREMLESGTRRERMGEAGLAHVREQFDQRLIVDRYLDVYRRVLGRVSAAA